jgi:hypothetical protein
MSKKTFGLYLRQLHSLNKLKRIGILYPVDFTFEHQLFLDEIWKAYETGGCPRRENFVSEFGLKKFFGVLFIFFEELVQFIDHKFK